MKYDFRLSGIAESLLESYQRDSDPFITYQNIRFPRRTTGFVELDGLRKLTFPNYWNSGLITQPENIEVLVKRLNALAKTFHNGMKPYPTCSQDVPTNLDEVLEEVPDFRERGLIVDVRPTVIAIISQLPHIRETLKKDVEAAYKGDPAARSYTDIIRSYPGFTATLIQRVAHVLYELQVPSYPRELTEQIHSLTGIDMHPGAKIGEYFFIDHGTGVVIGETAEIGNWVRVYQGVTLGVLHFEKEGEGVLKKGYKRHPTIGNHVVIGAGAKILGPVSIGDYVNIGANSWVEENIPANTTIFADPPKLNRKQK